MGGASSWYAMLAITGFLTSIWTCGKIAAHIGVSSIVLEVGMGIVLGPQVANLIPSQYSKCFEDQTVNCDDYKHQRKTADKGYKYCDIEEYMKEGKYYPSDGHWTDGFWGNITDGYLVIPGYDGKYSGAYCLDPAKPDCSDPFPRRLLDALAVPVESLKGSRKTHMGVRIRRLKGDKKGKTDYDTYSECVKESCLLDEALECATVPDIFTLVGHTGVAMMIFESGLHFDFEQAKTVGPWASIVAVLGTFLPIVSGAALAVAYGFDFMPDALSAGVSLAPTSVGIALKLLHEARALQTYFGQAVMTAAFVDDVLSLILFSILFSLGDDMTFMSFFPLIMGCLFMMVAIIAAVKVWPGLIKFILSKVPEHKPHAKVTTHDEVLWLLMFFTLVSYGMITHLCGTHLWGCFIGGMSFALNHHSHHVWVKQVKRVTCWFLRIFFACTLAWSIPVDELFSLEAFLRGSLMGIGPCILTKVLCGPFMGSSRWVIGWAMVGRAEFAYFIAILAKSVNMMDNKLFAILVWALIYATIFAPLIFRKVLARYMARQENAKEAESPQTGKLSKEDSRESGGSKRGSIFSIMSTGSQANHRHHSGHLPDIEGEEKEEMEEEMRQNYKAMQAQIDKQEMRMVELNREWEEKHLAQKAEIEDKDAEIEELKEKLICAIKTGNGEYSGSI